MYIQNLSSDILNLSEKLLISDISKLRNIVLSSSWIIFIKKELISNSNDALGESLILKYGQNSKYKKLYSKFLSLINSNVQLENSINNFIKENVQHISYFPLKDINSKEHDIHVFESEIIEKFDNAIENAITLLSVISKLHNNYPELKEYFNQQNVKEEVLTLLLDSKLHYLLHSYVYEINNNKVSDRIDKKTKAAQDLNKQLIDEISSLKNQLQESMVNESYKDKLLSNLTEQMAIMQVDEIEDNIKSDLENEKILSTNLKSEIINLKKEIEEKSIYINNMRELMSSQMSSESKFRYLFFIMSFYSVTITFILIMHIRSMKYTRRYAFNRCHDISD